MPIPLRASASLSETAIKMPSRRIRSACCARAASGHAAAAPQRSMMNSRRSMGFPRAEGHAGQLKEYHILDRELCGRWHLGGPQLMSALGQKQTLGRARRMSALPPKADMDQQGCDVRFVPKAGIQAA